MIGRIDQEPGMDVAAVIAISFVGIIGDALVKVVFADHFLRHLFEGGKDGCKGIAAPG